MNTFYGTKKILAMPMTLAAYNQYHGMEIEEGAIDKPGYLVEYLDSPNSNHPNHANYISWSPADVFEASYQPITNMSFGHAIAALKDGKTISRKNWNGKNMFLYYVPPNEYPAERNTNRAMIGRFDGDMVPYRDYIAMFTAQGDVVPWVASQTDILANDWFITDQ